MFEILLREILARLDQIDGRLGGVESRLDRVESRLDAMESRLDRVETRLDRVESRQDAAAEEHRELVSFLGLRFGRIDERFDSLEGRLEGIERVSSGTGVLAERLDDKIGLVIEKVDANTDNILRLERDTSHRFSHMVNTFDAWRGLTDERFDRLESA